MNLGLRVWVPGAVLATAVVLAGGWFVGVNPQLEAAAAADQTSATVESANSATRLRLVALSKQAAKLDSMRAEQTVLQKAVPAILKPNTFIRRINEVAALNGVTMTTVAPSPALAYAPAPSLVADQGQGALPLGKTDPAITAANFTVVPVSVTVVGTTDAVFSFEHDIQNDERLFAISTVSTTKDDKGTVTAVFGGTIYTLKR